MKFAVYIPVRYVFTFLASSGLAILYGLKVNLSVAIVAMVNHTALLGGGHDQGSHGSPNITYACEAPDSGNVSHSATSQDGPFAWSEPVQGLVLGAYFWGYIVTQIPGGRVAEMFSAKWVVWASVLINAVFTLITPVAADFSYGVVIAVRVIEGLGAGVSLPAMHVMLSKWAPPAEKGRIASLVYAGMSLGTVISLPLSGALAAAAGWASVFYVQGGLSLLWCLLWAFLVFDSPLTHPFISDDEKEYLVTEMNLKPIETKKGEKRKSLPVPWKSVVTSMPFWAIAISHTCSNWGWYMVLVELPTYMKQILRFNISQNAGLSAIPYLSMWLFNVFLSTTMDKLRAKKILNLTQVRKISTGIASLLPAAMLVGVALVGCDRAAAVALMTVSVMFISGMYCGFLTNHVDIAPNYAGTLMALTNTLATIPGFIVPVFVGEMTHGNQSLERWQIIFFITAAIYIVELVVYSIFASGEEQKWNKAFIEPGSEDDKPPEVFGH